MEIPYTVKPRPDTGLYNAKIGIWLFLASEVMLFGALFSSYILLRIGADEWPHNMLDVPIGTFNTGVLIFSSICVVLSWSALKMNDLKRFKFWMRWVVVCAVAFLCIKSFEYHNKFTHVEVWLKNGHSVTGHLEGKPMFATTADLEGKDHIMFILDDWKHGTRKKYQTDETRQTIHPKGAASENLAHAEVEPRESSDDVAPTGEDHGHVSVRIETSDIKRLCSFIPSHSTYFAIYFTMTGLHALHVFLGALVLGYFLTFGIGMYETEPERFTNRIEVGGLFWHFVDLVWIFLFPTLYLL